VAALRLLLDYALQTALQGFSDAAAFPADLRSDLPPSLEAFEARLVGDVESIRLAARGHTNGIRLGKRGRPSDVR
jgi:hypothetical protein